MEYLLLHGGSRGHLLRYKLLWDGGSGEENHLCGLLNVDDNEGGERKSGSDEGKSDANESKSALSLVQVGAKSDRQKVASDQTAQGNDAPQVCPAPDAVIRRKKKTPPPPSPSLPESFS